MSDEARDELLHRMLSGELDADAPEARRLLADPEARSEFERLRMVRDRLRGAAEGATDEPEADLDRHVAALLEGARDDPSASERRREFREFARAAAPPAGPSAPESTGRVLSLRSGLFAVAAAILIGLAIGLRTIGDRSTSDPGPLLLGTGEGALVAPLGEVEAYPPFVWELELSRDGTYTLVIRDADDEAAPPFEVRELEEPRWDPGRREGELPRRLTWRVEAHDEFGVMRARTATGVAWRAGR